MPNSHPSFARAIVSTFLFAAIVSAQQAYAQQRPSHDTVQPGSFALALTYTAARANSTQLNQVWLNGGSIELTVSAHNGLGISASVIGLHSANIGNSIPLNLVATTFGPSFRTPIPDAKYPFTVFAHGLIGQANGFSGLYPSATGPISSSNSLAVNLGAGTDLKLRSHVSVRVLEVSWLRTQLPNAAQTTQNNLTLSAGIVYHSR